MVSNFISQIRIGLIDPTLLIVVWNIKRSNKTFLSYTKIFSLINCFMRLKKKFNSPLLVSEFGVGRGGSATILAWLIGHYGGKLMLFDVFDRIPPPTEKDGQQSISRYEDILHHEDKDYYGNITDLFNTIQSEIKIVCDLSRVDFIKGKFEDILPEIREKYKFNLVHIDCDWYESTRSVLDFLRDNLHPYAILQIDDYSNWQGSHLAVDEAKWLKPTNFEIVDGALVAELSPPITLA